MERDFLEYTEALKLKELGFDEPCFGQFYKHPSQEKEEFRLFKDCDWENRTTSYWAKNISSHFVSTPTYSQCYRFFREKHNLITYIGWVYKKTKGIDWFFNIKGIEMINNNVLPHNEIRFNTYEEAELECLKKLIEIVKKK
jgi:hypothetical protein